MQDAHVLADLQLDNSRPNATDVCMSDRFVPSRGTLCSSTRLKLQNDENWVPRNEYHEVLLQNVLGKEASTSSRLLQYRPSPPLQDPTHGNGYRVMSTCSHDGALKLTQKPTRVLPQSATKVLDAPRLIDDFYSHPVDWSARNVVAVALSEMVFLFDAESGQTDRLLALPSGNATALRWMGEGVHLGVGTSAGEVKIWDACAQRQLRSLRGHSGRIGALAWHGHVLSSGSADAEIHHHDVRVKDHLVGRLSGAHTDFICGLDYSTDGVLASGGNDNAVCIWESPSASSPLHTLSDHKAAVKALRWCPWQRQVLATGGGSADRQVCLWNASSGRLLASADAESQVTGVVWGQQERELLTAHGYSRNQLSLWKFPSLVKVGDLEGHSGRLLGLTQSPDGSLVCSSSADETLRFWRVFSPRSEKKQNTPNSLLRSIR